tara:strand:- start:769 stop:888 length:120 start_codon:yes stop_codon:yes gene_type:complete
MANTTTTPAPKAPKASVNDAPQYTPGKTKLEGGMTRIDR